MRILLATSSIVGGTILSSLQAQDLSPSPKEIAVANNEESSWSPDGKKLAFDSSRADGKNYNIYVLDIAPAALNRLTASSANDITPAWSPDSKTLAFTSDRSGHNEIYLMAADGSAVRQLTHDDSDDIHPNWSPDGRKVIYCSARNNPDRANAPEGERYEIYEVDVGQAQSRQVTKLGGINTFPTYSPDGKHIAFRKVLGERNSEVWVMESDGTNPRNLTKNPAFDGWPCWSPDGQRIVFASNRGGADYNIYAMRADGTDVRQLTDLKGRCTSPKWVPDGSKISFDHAANGRCGIMVVEIR
jgi:TolB protein